MKYCVVCGCALDATSRDTGPAPTPVQNNGGESVKSDGTRACPSCSAPNPTDALFCNRCGLPQNTKIGSPLTAKPKQSWWRETGGILWLLIEWAIVLLAIWAPFAVFYDQGFPRYGSDFHLWNGFVSALLMTLGSVLGLLILPNPIGRRMRAWLKKRGVLR